MKTTVDLPEELFGAARRYASAHGKTFKDVLIESLESFIGRPGDLNSRPGWEALFGAFSASPDISVIRETVDNEFSRINSEDWT